jgi:2-polyprenyl-3-methyl-5-hydroxy-6-metoxy-1,4-benzoquinol methylase
MIVHKSCPNCGNANISFVLSAKDYTVSDESFEIWECGNCTLRFTQNAPGSEEIGKYYQSENYISHSDTAKGFINNLYHKVRKHTLIQKRKLIIKTTGKSMGNILDLGCGTGAFLDTMQHANWKCSGIEPDENARQKAQELYGLQVKATDEFYNFPSETFDAITLWHVLEHVHDLHSYIQQLRKLLAPGGKLFIAVPNYNSADEKMYNEYWAAYDVPRHLYHFSPKAMRQLMDTHGLEIEKMKPMWYDSIYVSMLSEQYKTGSQHPVTAMINGMVSNLEATFDHKKCSSLIYIISLKRSELNDSA